MEPVIIIIPGTEFITIHVRLPGDMVYTGIRGPAGDFLLVSAMVGSVGDFILTEVGGGHVAITTVIVMDTDMVPGPVTEPDIGRAREMPLKMYTVKGLQVLVQGM